MTAITTAAHIDAQTQEDLMRQAGIWIEHSTLIEDDLPARPLAAVQAEKHHLDRYTQLVADRAAARGSKCLAQIEEPAGAAPAAVAPLPAVFEQIAQSWDGCMYDAPGETLDIGADIRAAAKRLLAEHPAAVAPQGEYPPLPEGVMFIEQIGGDVIARPTEYAYFKNARGVVHGAQLFTADQLRAYFDLGRQPEAPALEAPAAPEGWRELFASAVYDDLAAADNQDVPLEEYPARILKVLDAVVGPRHPAVILWRNDAIQACIAIAYKYCRDPESFQYLKQDLQGLVTAVPTQAAAPQAPAAPWKDHLTARLVNDLRDCAIKYHGAGQLRDRIAHIVAPLCDQLKAAQAAPAAPAEGEVLVEVIGLTGSGKSAICGEIEILCRALGLDVSWPDGDPEKNMTHAEWTAAIEAYKPRVRIVERNVPRQSNGGPAK
nr:hypothetical protein [Delftia acidovorans]